MLSSPGHKSLGQPVMQQISMERYIQAHPSEPLSSSENDDPIRSGEQSMDISISGVVPDVCHSCLRPTSVQLACAVTDVLHIVLLPHTTCIMQGCT